MFARRPKVVGKKNLIVGKINSELIQFAQAARSVGIPTIGGFPAVESLYELYCDPAIFWFPVVDLPNDGDFHFFVDLSRHPPSPIDIDDHFVQTMSLSQVIQDVKENSEVMPWNDAMQRISQLRLEHYRDDSYFRFNWFGGYKPVYFILPHKD